ncbi:MAG: winged helix-turn-helix transcriptional regulator [Candidatus Bathyarchaeia archaeon]|nr:winged helix-turn-helix transcriptional regulator [Candidatus Bathyarchaeota archaeon]
MTQEAVKDLREKMNALLTIQKAPSQFAILSHLLSTRRTMTIKELSTELNLTPKAAERAMAKLLEKGLIQRTPFRDGGYTCDSNIILLSLLLATSEIYEKLSRMEATSGA